MHCVSLGPFNIRGVKGRGVTVFHPSTSHCWSFLYTFPFLSPTISSASVPHTFPLPVRSPLLHPDPPFSLLSSLPLCLFIKPSSSFNPLFLSPHFYLSLHSPLLHTDPPPLPISFSPCHCIIASCPPPRPLPAPAL